MIWAGSFRQTNSDARGLTPEEDAIGDPEDQDDEIDDLLPADLWFNHPSRP